MSNFNTILNCANTNLLAAANNLSDVSSASTARSNLGLGAAALLADPIVPAHGGTGLTTLTAHGVLLGEGTSNVGNTGAGGSAQVLIGQGAADPTWNTISGLFALSSAGVASINSQTVSLTAIAAIANNTILGNNSGGSASPSALTASQVNTLLGFVTSGVGGTSGSITFPGGMIMNWGDIGSQTTGATGTVTFATSYSSGSIVTINPITAAGVTTFLHLTSASSTTGFSWKNESQNITGGPWIAVGK